MGLLDWLDGAIGGGGSGGMMGGMDPMGGATGQMMPNPTPAPAPTQPMPPPQGPGMDAPNLADPMTQPMPGGQGAGPTPVPDPSTQAIISSQGGGGFGGGAAPVPAQNIGGLPPATPPGGAPPGPASLPPAAQPASGQMPPGPPMSIAPPPSATPPGGGGFGFGGTGAGPPGSGQGAGILGRALGLSPDQAQKLSSGWAAGLKSVGDNAHKPGLAAFASSAGSGMEGSENRGDKNYKQRIDYLQQAISAKRQGDTAAYNQNYAKYLQTKVDNETKKAADKEAGKGSSAWNKPPQQLFLDASRATSQDPDIKASQKVLDGVIKTGDPAAVSAAQQQHSQLVASKQREYLSGVGLKPDQIAANLKNPPGTQPNPVTAATITSKEDFDRYVKPGDWFINPKDGKLLQRKGGGQTESTSAPTQPSPPAAAPLAAPGPAPGTKADEEE